jgi:hypothetical protein
MEEEIRELVGHLSIALTARPISQGIRTVIPIAAQANANEPQSWGR